MTTPTVGISDRTGDRDRAEIEQDIERTREQLGEIVAALTDRLNVKDRMKRKVTTSTRSAKASLSTGTARTKAALATGTEGAKARPALAAGVAVTAVVLVITMIAWRRTS
jgi:hypothetical protein